MGRLLRKSFCYGIPHPRVGDRVEQEVVQIQRAAAKFYAKMLIGKDSDIGMLAEYTVAIGCGLSCKQLLCQQPHNNYIHSSLTVDSYLRWRSFTLNCMLVIINIHKAPFLWLSRHEESSNGELLAVQQRQTVLT